ncbi:MAG: hypothetical protein IJ435_06720 [Clostridia bacterium]|nr:hypothetical protein [Clostridia bacterium]
MFSINKEQLQYKQESDVFLSLCPCELLKSIFAKGQLPYPQYVKNLRMIKALGFSELAEVYIMSDHVDKRKKTRLLADCDINHPDFDEKPLVRQFVFNIHSPIIRSMFIKRINEYYNAKIFNES